MSKLRYYYRGIVLAVVAAIIVAAAVGLAGAVRHVNTPVDQHQTVFVGSETCQQCHGDRHESWYATFHRTMTQEASPASVQGQFDGQSLDYWGLRVRPISDNGRYFFEYASLDTGEILTRMEIERTVGSHRYQQYLTRLPEDGTFVRLHYLWHNGDQRWVHMNAAFLGPDEQPFDNNVAIWNQNCIFCHNTGPQPGMTNYDDLRTRSMAGEPVNVATDSRFQSQVAELGIACETCHGPGGEHVSRADSLLDRLAMRLNRGRDAAIVNPERLDAKRSTQICGQCHGQRTPKTSDLLHEWVHGGPTYRAGMNLDEHVDPVWRHTRAPVRGEEDMFSLRFWADGTPRLSAYEYQGLLLSKCYQEAELSCIDCHSVHGGDPAGQITERNRGNAPCLACHEDFRSEPKLVEHTGHEAQSIGSVCYNCHMPDAAYGVMDIHRTHRIESPDALRDAGAGRPNACLNCHLDRSPVWAAEATGQAAEAIHRLDGADANLSEAAAMLAGDPVQKAIVAYRAGQPGAGDGMDRMWLVPYLLEAMADKYPSSRRFARQSLLQLLEGQADDPALAAMRGVIQDFDFIADLPRRQHALTAAMTHWRQADRRDWPVPPEASRVDADYQLPESVLAELRDLGARQDKQISIGE